jgi:hypothetical protein
MTGFEVVIPEHSQHRNPKVRAKIGREQLSFLREAIIRQVATNKQDIGFA